jgi:hypothetical protein
MSTKKSSSRNSQRRITLSDRTKKVLLAGTGSVLVVAIGWWAYFTFTTVAPPNVQAAPPPQVAQYLGNARGFARLNCDERGKFLGDMWNAYSQGEKRGELAQAFNRMSFSERQVFVDAAFETVKVDFLKQANEFNKLPKSKKDQFVDNVMNQLDQQRRAIAGSKSSNNNVKPGVPGRPEADNKAAKTETASLTEPFESCVPTTTDGMAKLLVTRTSATDRAKAEGLFDAITARYKAREEQRRRQ